MNVLDIKVVENEFYMNQISRTNIQTMTCWIKSCLLARNGYSFIPQVGLPTLHSLTLTLN